MKTPATLFIAGLDPSAGAGLLADIKTAEQLGVYGVGVVTALTYQNDREFIGLDWVDIDSLIKQCDPLFSRFKIEQAKIGIVPDAQYLAELVSYLKKQNNKIQIIWDPVVESSTGFKFFDAASLPELAGILPELTLVTPNQFEALSISGVDNLDQAVARIAEKVNVLLTGLEIEQGVFQDSLYTSGSDQLFCKSFEKAAIIDGAKHGSGCVLSSAITCELTKGKTLEQAVESAQEYIGKFLASSTTLLGRHAA